MLRIAVAMTMMLATTAARAAEPLGLQGESPLEVQGKVVDILCDLSGNCPPDCGAGKRQLGLVTSDGRLLLAAKGPVNFAGAVVDLLPHCGKNLHADGLLIEHADIKLYMVQAIRQNAGEPWQPAERFAETWTAAHGPAEEWQRADPRVKRIIETRGKLGIPGLNP